MAEKIPFSRWYHRGLIANAWYSPWQSRIRELAAYSPLEDRSKDEVRTLFVSVDDLADFTHPATFLSITTGKVFRLLPSILNNVLKMPESFYTINSEIIWTDDEAALDRISKCESMLSGRLSVPNAWVGTRDSAEWCLAHADRITDYATIRDRHPLTARWNMHYWEALNRGNAWGLKEKQRPVKSLGCASFYFVTPEMVWNEHYNPSGWLKPIFDSETEADEAYTYVKGCGGIVLWDEHCTDGTYGACMDPVMMSVIMDHAYRRKAEPYNYDKGRSTRSDQIGVTAMYHFSGDRKARTRFSANHLLNGGTTLIGRPYDQIVVKGQARTHCVPSVVKDMARELHDCGRGHQAHRIIYLPGFCQMIPGFEQKAEALEAELRDMGVRVETDPEKVFD